MRLRDLYVSAFQPLNVSRNKARCNTCGLRLLARVSKMKMHLIKFHLSLAEQMKIKPSLKKLCRLIPITFQTSSEEDRRIMSPKAIKYFEMQSSDDEGEREMIEARSQPASPDSPKIYKRMHMTLSEDEEVYQDMVIRRSQPASPDYPGNFKRMHMTLSEDEEDNQDMVIRRSQPASPEDNESRFLECRRSLIYEEMIVAPSRGKTLDNSKFLEYCSSFLDDSLGIFDINQFIDDVKSYTGRDVVNDYILLHTDDDLSGIKDVITNELRDKMLTIRYEVSGSKMFVKAVYYCDILRKVITRSLDISTQEYGTNELFDALKEYGIEKKSIYSHSLETRNIMSIEHQELTSKLNAQKIGPLTVLDNAIDECIKSMQLDDFIFEIRLLMKKHEHEILHFNSSLLTCNSWMSIYHLLTMFNRNLNLFGNIEQKWNFVPKFITALELIVELVKTADLKQNRMGDFFASWLTTSKNLQMIAQENVFAFMLFGHFRLYVRKLIEIEDFRSAIYMDPRFNHCESNILTDEDKQMALSHLMKTYNRIQQINSEAESYNSQDFLLKIFNLQFQTKCLFNNDALLHWMQESDDRELTKLAKVVLVAPATYCTMHCST